MSVWIMHLTTRFGFKPAQLVCSYALGIELVNADAQTQEWEFVHYIRSWECGPRIASIELWRHKLTQTKVVWKECDVKGQGQGANELNLLSLFYPTQHPNLVKVSHLFLDQDDASVFYIGLESFHERDLDWFLLRQKELFTFEKSLSIFWQIVCGLRCLHQSSIVHEDICPRNILVKDETLMHVAICDLGLAQHDDGALKLVNEQCRGRHTYRAPEDVFTTKSDIYGLGVLARGMFYLRHKWCTTQTEMDRRVAAYCKEHLEEMVRKGCTTFAQCWDESIVNVMGWPPKWMRDLIEHCVSEKPEERPSCEEILKLISANETLYSNDWITCHLA